MNGYAEDIQKQQQQQQPQDTKTMWKCVFIMKIGKTTKTYEKSKYNNNNIIYSTYTQLVYMATTTTTTIEQAE